jgi:ABC-type sugar transport system permease subunit
MGYGSAIGVVLLALTLVLSLIQLRVFAMTRDRS